MAMLRPRFTTGDKSSPTPAIRGAAMAAEASTAGWPESQDKRQRFFARNAVASAGATPIELTADGLAAYRLRLVQSSIINISGVVTYFSSVTRESWTVNGTYANINGVLTALGTPTITKTTASTAVFAVTTDNPSESLIFTGTGVAGDAAGWWSANFRITEVTEIG